MKNRFKVNLILILDLILILLCVKLLAPILGPDVHFASSAFSGLATVGKDAEFDAVIINRGILPALKVDVCLMDNYKTVIKKTTYFLKKGEKADIVFKCKFLEQGTHRVKMLLGCKERKDLGYSFETKVEVLPSPSANSTLFKKKLGNAWYSTQFSGSSPAIYNGKLYVGGKNEYFFCLNKDTGEEIWSYKVISAGLFPGIYTTPVFYKGNVYFGSTGSSLIENGGHIFALNAENGSLVWKYDTSFDVYEISLDDGKIYTYDGKFTYAIDAVTGKLIKKYEGTVIAHNGKLYSVDDVNGVLLHIDPLTGKVIWSFNNGGEIYATPAFFSGKIYIDGKLCLDEEKGTLIWKNGDIGGVHMAFDNGLLFVVEGKLYCVDANNGKIEWEKEIGSIASPVPANNKVYVAPYTGDYEKKVFCLNETTSDIIEIYEVGDVVTTAPLVYDGKVYVVAEDGYLYCFKEE